MTETAFLSTSYETLEALRVNLTLGCLKALGFHEEGTLFTSRGSKACPAVAALSVTYLLLEEVEEALATVSRV